MTKKDKSDFGIWDTLGFNLVIGTILIVGYYVICDISINYANFRKEIEMIRQGYVVQQKDVRGNSGLDEFIERKEGTQIKRFYYSIDGVPVDEYLNNLERNLKEPNSVR